MGMDAKLWNSTKKGEGIYIGRSYNVENPVSSELELRGGERVLEWIDLIEDLEQMNSRMNGTMGTLYRNILTWLKGFETSDIVVLVLETGGRYDKVKTIDGFKN